MTNEVEANATNLDREAIPTFDLDDTAILDGPTTYLMRVAPSQYEQRITDCIDVALTAPDEASAREKAVVEAGERYGWDAAIVVEILRRP